LWKLKVTVVGLGIDVLESLKENSRPVTEMVVAAAWAGRAVAEASPAGASAAVATAESAAMVGMARCLIGDLLGLAMGECSRPAWLLSSAGGRL
jgi:hypothetical protein